MLFIGLSDTIEVVSADDDAVTPHEGVEASWFPRFTDKAEVGQAARVFTVRPLNGREWASVANTVGLPRLYEGCAKATVTVYPPLANRDGELLDVTATVNHLELGAATGLFQIAKAITHGKDPFAKEEAADSVAPKSDPG